jgi:putative NADH-flavin reductase
MKVALIGASGFVGSCILNELLNRGHQVTGIVRDVNKVKLENDLLTLKETDVTNTALLVEAISGVDAVISSYNAGWTNPNLYNDFLNGSKAIQQAVKTAGIDRLIVVGGAGSLQIDGKQLVDGPDFPESIKPGATAARDYLNYLKEERELKWTFFSPAIEMHEGGVSGRTGVFKLGTTSPVFNKEGRSILSPEDVAVAVVDELEQNNYIQQQFTAAY